MNLLAIGYIILSAVVVLGTFYVNYTTGRTIQGAMLATGLLIAAVLFGIRWFVQGVAMVAPAPGNWPPYINSCPDFMSVVKGSGGKPVCVDPVGVGRSDLAAQVGGTALTKWTQQSQVDGTNSFPLFAEVSSDTTRKQNICDECKRRGITWEGVWDGTNCLAMPPRPPA